MSVLMRILASSTKALGLLVLLSAVSHSKGGLQSLNKVPIAEVAISTMVSDEIWVTTGTAKRIDNAGLHGLLMGRTEVRLVNPDPDYKIFFGYTLDVSSWVYKGTDTYTYTGVVGEHLNPGGKVSIGAGATSLQINKVYAIAEDDAGANGLKILNTQIK